MTRLNEPWVGAAATRKVCEALSGAGHQVLFVGGCVRNALLRRPVSDIDLATDALPEDVVSAVGRAGLKPVPTGIDHGTITVVADGVPFEVTTFRDDIETDGRHARVRFSRRMEDDAARRDFTMNALYATPDGEVLDPINGLPDLRAGRVRFIGDPQQRIAEDYLRILRFFRFTAWYGDPAEGVNAEGLAACAVSLDGLERLSSERIGAELRKLLAAPDPSRSVAAMSQIGVLSRVLPGTDARSLPVLVDFEQRTGAEPDSLRRLAALGGPMPDKRLRLSRADVKRLEVLRTGVSSAAGPAVLGYRFGTEAAISIILLRGAFFEAPPQTDLLHEILRGASSEFPVSAADLMASYQGAALGTRLRKLETLWLESEFTMTREALLDVD